MQFRTSSKPLAALAVAAVGLGPAAVALAAEAPSTKLLRPKLGDHHTAHGALRDAGHDALVRRYLRQARAADRRVERRVVRRWSTDRLRRELRTLRERPAPAQGGMPAGVPAHLQAIAACESGGNPRAVGGGGQYRGLFQFDRGTWAAVGGSGDPAAASPAEQYRRAAILYARAGSSPWPVCG